MKIPFVALSGRMLGTSVEHEGGKKGKHERVSYSAERNGLHKDGNPITYTS